MTAPLRAILLLGGALVAIGGTPVRADTLRDALNGAYRTNPTLQAARAQQRAVDESVPIEKSAGRPNVTGSAQYIEFVKQSSSSFTAPERAILAGADLGVPIYSGGAVRNAVKAAETRVEAGQADLRGTESAIFTQVVAAYMDVIRGEALVGLNASQVEVLTVNTQATSDRFEIGDLTRTDVAQSQARLALAQGNYRSAQANLVNARETYIQLTGLAPDDLQPPPPLPGLPASAEDAVAVALEQNPDIIAARERAEASRYDINVAGSGRLPRVSIFTGADYNNYLGTISSPTPGVSIPQTSTAVQAGVSVSIPLFQGGRPAALQRQAQARSAAALENVIATERDVIAQVRSAYSSWLAATQIIASNQTAVDAAALSLEGVRAENTVGNRTILDILNAEQELVNARAQLITARRNAYVAGFSLLAAMGRAEARDLGLEDDGPLYDPQVNYDRVRNKWNDWSRDPDPIVQSTRTVDIPAPTAEIRVNDDSAPVPLGE
ncbi:TolC family outer membrane protein [Tsuneonella sp. YG55]|uniref:TolC family outer membrane protein n=1 Tax=Tsuneonella litorea TaxID=2976475 RepID=A0A9X2W0Y1_9SPHN|nr:TolC family outer membrane protein [Tsuneonella litorea]MCT2557890.1 TolC family outer membrane protein [Tsuneonella litorea]